MEPCQKVDFQSNIFKRVCVLELVSVSEHLGRVRNVVLIKCIFGSGRPPGGRDFGQGATWAE